MKWTLILLLGSFLAETTLGWTYHHSSKTMNWTTAREWCKATYTDMVIIQNQDENDYLVSKLPTKRGTPYYWLGITKNHQNESWTWIGNNSTWIGEMSWAANEPSNRGTEFCVEIYVNNGENRGKWNDDKCSLRKYAVCYQAQCSETSCIRGTCQETIENTTCLCEPGFEGDRCQTASCGSGTCQKTTENRTCLYERDFEGEKNQTAVECPPLSQPDNGYLSCPQGNQTFNSTCRFKCHPGFLMIGLPAVTCGVTGVWSGPRPACTNYKQALLAVAGCGALSAFCCLCFCWMKHRKRKKVAQVRQPEEVTCPASDAQE